MIFAQCHQFAIRVSRGGALLPWIGPALRGLVAERFKNAVCLQPEAERVSRWKLCKGCPYLPDCPYGRMFEPDPPEDAKVFHGQDDATRPLVLAPYYPLPADVRRGLDIPLRVLLVARNGDLDAATNAADIRCHRLQPLQSSCQVVVGASHVACTQKQGNESGYHAGKDQCGRHGVGLLFIKNTSISNFTRMVCQRCAKSPCVIPGDLTVGRFGG
ncbi:MAG: hypothetical protein ACC645_05380, partial [Pirellulales bacterium]